MKKYTITTWVFIINRLKTNNITPIHQDNFYWNLKSKNGCTVYIPLDKQNKTNGSIGYFLGSHKGKTFTHQKSKTKAFSSYLNENKFRNHQLEYIDVEPGDIVFHHCNIAHTAYKNKTKIKRECQLQLLFMG